MIIPKLSYEIGYTILISKINMGFPTDFRSNNYVRTPEVDISLPGIVYGDNFFDKNLYGIGSDKLSFGLNIPIY